MFDLLEIYHEHPVFSLVNLNSILSGGPQCNNSWRKRLEDFSVEANGFVVRQQCRQTRAGSSNSSLGIYSRKRSWHVLKADKRAF